MTILEVDFDTHAATLEELFRAYHAWTKERFLATVGDRVLPVDQLDAHYDVDAFVNEDIDYLSDPSTNARLFVAGEESRIDGFVYLKWRSADIAEVKRLFVRPEARGRGLGRALMENLIDAARDDGCTRLVLQSGPHSEIAHTLYADLGFDHTSPYECEVPEDAHDVWTFMRLKLEETNG